MYARLIETGERLAAAYREGLVGTVREVLLEERLPAGGIIGYTPEYVHVRVETGEPGQFPASAWMGSHGKE